MRAARALRRSFLSRRAALIVALCAPAAMAGGAHAAAGDAVVPPLLTGPGELTNIAAPALAWTLDGADETTEFSWELLAAGAPAALYTGQGAGLTVTLPSLPDGDYVFRVRPTAEQDPAGTAERSFRVDTTAPGPVRITVRPGFPAASSAATFGWAEGESGATFTWRVVGSAGVVAQGPTATMSAQVTTAPLNPGTYIFQISQTDTAGNTGPAVAQTFAVVQPPAAPPPATTQRIVLPRLNAAKLRPALGQEINSVAPLLRWAAGGPRTTVYNVQVFLATSRQAAGGTTVRMIKLRSVFPRARKVRVRGLKPGRCYVWRVWPFVGTRHTAQPLGISNFCVSADAKPRRAKA